MTTKNEHTPPPPMAWITDQQHRVDAAHHDALRHESDAHHARNVAGKTAWDAQQAEAIRAETAAASAAAVEQGFFCC